MSRLLAETITAKRIATDYREDGWFFRDPNTVLVKVTTQYSINNQKEDSK